MIINLFKMKEIKMNQNLTDKQRYSNVVALSFFVLLSQSVFCMEQKEYYYEKHQGNNGYVYGDTEHTEGKKHEIGKEVPKNIELAVKYYKLAADQGHTEAQYSLGKIYAEGQYALTVSVFSSTSWITGWQPSITYDYNLAHYYYKKAADQGHIEAQYKVGKMYEIGQGVDKDIPIAFKYYELAADQGQVDATLSLRALRNRVGKVCCDRANKYAKSLLFAKGSSISREHELEYLNLAYKDYYSAFIGYDIISTHQDLIFVYKLGKRCENFKNYKLAFKYYELAADQGHDNAQHDLGYMYQKGKGVIIDIEKSIHYYKKSAEQENVAAQNNLGHIFKNKYKNGVDKSHNLNLACYYYKLAADRGHPEAKVSYYDLERFRGDERY